MPETWTVALSRRVGSLAQHLKQIDVLEIGDPVLVRGRHSPLARQSGRVVEIAQSDLYGAYLVIFDNGLRFRYRRHELLALTSASQTHEAKSAITERPLY